MVRENHLPNPSRYAGGVIALGSDEWESYLGLADGDAAARFLAATGRAVTQVKDAAGVTRELRVFHWWTEVYDLEAGRWLALDSAWKPRQLAEVDGLPLTLQYAAATAADQQLLDTWKESFFPGYLVQLHAVLEGQTHGLNRRPCGRG